MDPGNGDDFADIPTRPMRVKVLYTFDAESKTTCLARFSNTLNIPAVAIDEQSQVGVIELQQCIQAIVNASPEILSQLQHGDFSVYSFDYSEYEAPVVGQGRLSSLLSASTPLLQGDRTMITGRVCKNVPALFSNGVKETLEVKFKLTPLSKPTHAEMSKKNNDALRSMSPATSAGFDPNAWSASQQRNTPHQTNNDYFNLGPFANDGTDGMQSLHDLFGMEAEGGGTVSGISQPGGVGIPQTPTDSTFTFNPAFSTQSHSAPGSRSGSPMMSSNPSTRNEHLRHQSFSTNPSTATEQNRPGSRASVRSESYSTQPQPQTVNQPFDETTTQQHTEIYYNEDGQPRKRAKVVQTDWRGKSSFGSRKADLRVTAATASSMHMFRPIAKRPSAPGSNLEPPPRVPTPVPQRTRPPYHRVPSAAPRSMLRQASIADTDLLSDIEPMSDAMTSPESNSPGDSITGETPMDIPSSPPIIPAYNLPQPSSPGLPTLPQHRMVDSGYMSERGFQSGNIMDSMEEDENRTPDAEDLETAAQYRGRGHQQCPIVKIEDSSADSQSSSLLGTQPHDDVGDTKRDGSQGSGQMAATNTPPDMKQIPEGSVSRRGSLALPPKIKQNSKPLVKQKKQPRQRSRTTTNDSEAGSPAPSDTEGFPRGARSGSGAPRRVVIEQRLQASLAKGEMPMFCSHCGAIHTPTWRKLYVKRVEGKPGPLDEVEGEGETIGIEVTERNSAGESTSFTVRKSMKKTKDFLPGVGFEDTVVCNPCGLYFNKFRKMRPYEMWHRRTGARKNRKKAEDFTDGPEPRSEAFFTDQIIPANIEDAAADDDQAIAYAAADMKVEPATALPETVVPRPRARSVQPQPRRAVSDDGIVRRPHRDPAYMRAIQSSPVRYQGSQETPIELDMTPDQPTRRLLFPSPRRSGEEKSLEGADLARPESAPSLSKGLSVQPLDKVIGGTETNVSIFEAFTYDKENVAPPVDEDNDLSHLFDGSPSAVFKTPARKTPSKHTPRSQRQLHFDHLLKTPTPNNRKRKPLTPNANAANNADVHDFMTSPSSSRYFLRSTPSRLDRTPGGRSVSGGSHAHGGGSSNAVSPFSQHLAAMLTESHNMSDGMTFTSPSRQYDFSDLPTMTTPVRDVDWQGLDEILGSEFASYDSNDVVFGGDQGGDEHA